MGSAAAFAVPFGMHTEPQHTVTLRAPGRLHLGFLDPSASLGRRFGSIGVVIEGFQTDVELSGAIADRVTADTPEGDVQMERVSAYLHTLRERSGRHDKLHLRLLHVLPAHGGFGSGTQLALAIARAFAQWHRIDVSTPTLAHWSTAGRPPTADPRPCSRASRCPTSGASSSCKTSARAAWPAATRRAHWPRSVRCRPRVPPRSATRS